MTTPLDLTVPPKVLSVLTTYGTTATHRAYASSFYDPATGHRLEGSATDTSVKIIPPFPASERYLAQNLYASGDAAELYVAGDLMTGIAGTAGVDPTVGSSIVLSGTEYKIVGRNVIRSGDSIALYLLHIRESRA